MLVLVSLDKQTRRDYSENKAPAMTGIPNELTSLLKLSVLMSKAIAAIYMLLMDFG